ncbi:LacI family DNA-binding transcriptional regulator [Paenibacillus sp. J2TS4]|uniref:LacI family DNA-binding transcriptional regulator n=1 Tax=Paenibacillus sp. J2TS4 TaxID=2807194 RepID=UPI001B154E32|nr:substrate-binding domain-containing protein [Paenibacillus sp. J2TS4]GIP33867.1 LacI family transcriptional regulator [Paenibacillus sp. J2TS4]
MVTIYDIAKKANVSAMTVSRVINNSGRISEKTRIKVKKIMEEMNYVPNSMARSLVLQETKILSLLITDITNPFFTTLARGAEDAAMRRGYKLLFGNSDENLQKEKEYVDMMLTARVDGVLFAPTGDASLEHLSILRTHNIPLVLLDREVPGFETDMVLGDSRAGARQLVEHLISLGHKRIALLNGPLHVSTARHRLAGYKEALKLNDLAYDDRLVVELDYKPAAENLAMDSLLQQTDPPTAIFAANNFLAIGAIRSLRAKGISVPKQISVVCFDDFGESLSLDPFLTVASQPAYQFGALGIQLLIERIQDKSEGDYRKIVLPPELIIRSSAQALNIM